MARHIRNPKVESRAARAKLRPSPKPVYFGLGGKLHLGYRKGQGKGVWVLRRYLGDERYATETIAEADDLADANGTSVLNFDQAQDKARERMKALDEDARIQSFGPVVTVRSAVQDYLNERSTARDAGTKLKHLLGDAALADAPLATLTVDDLKRWRASLIEKMLEASARRVVNDARACLNAAVKRHNGKLPPLLRDIIRDGLAIPRGVHVDNGRKKQILSDADIRRVIDAAGEVDRKHGWGGDLHLMVLILAATGARFSQVARLRVGDLQVNEQRLMMPTSRKGTSGSKVSHSPVPLGGDVIDILKRAVAGRIGTEPLLTRPRWRRAPGGAFGVLEKYSRGAWGDSTNLTEPWRRVITKAGLPSNVIPYSLRHSSIVRGLRAGLPTQLVAKLHDTSSQMIEHYYGRFVSDALDTLARAAIIPLVSAPVTPLRVVES